MRLAAWISDALSSDGVVDFAGRNLRLWLTA